MDRGTYEAKMKQWGHELRPNVYGADWPYIVKRDAYGNEVHPNQYLGYATIEYDEWEGIRKGNIVECTNGRTATVLSITDLLIGGGRDGCQYFVLYHNLKKGQHGYGYLKRRHIRCVRALDWEALPRAHDTASG